MTFTHVIDTARLQRALDFDLVADAEARAAMAQDLGVTSTHLSRACRSALGASAHELLNERVMYAARERLRGSQAPVNRIAQDLGFSSAAYFTRAFQKSTGESPSRFRRSA